MTPNDPTLEGDMMNDAGGPKPVEATPFDDIIDSDNMERVQNGLPSLEDVAKQPVPTNTDLLEPIRKGAENLMHDPMGLVNSIYGVGQSAVYGLGQGLQEGVRTTNELGAATSAPGDAIEGLIRKHIFNQDDNTVQGVFAHRDDVEQQIDESIPNIAEMLGVPKPDNAVENIVATATPFIVGTLYGEEFLNGLGLASKLGGIEVPGVAGQALSRLGLTGERMGKSVSTMLAGLGSFAGLQPAVSGNTADMLKDLSNTPNLQINLLGQRVDVGRLAKLWYENVPGESLLSHNADDSPLTGRLKNALDMGYTDAMGASIFTALKGLKLLGEAGVGGLKGAALKSAIEEQKLNEAVLNRMGEASGSQDALDVLFPKAATGTESAANGVLKEGELDPEILPPSKKKIEARVEKTGTAPPADGAPIEKQGLGSWLGLNDKQILERANAARETRDAAEAAQVSDLKNKTRRYSAFIDQVGKAQDASSFDSEGYFNHIKAAAESDDPNALHAALDDYGLFVQHKDGAPPPLLTPRQVEAWNDDPNSPINQLVGGVKRLISTNEARKADAQKWLAEKLGGGEAPFDTNYDTVAKTMLGETSESTKDVQLAGRRLLMNNDMLHNYLLPNLGTAIKVASKDGATDEDIKTVLALVKRGSQFKEANKNLKSEVARVLQSAQIDPESEASLKALYGGRELANEYSPQLGDDLDELLPDGSKISAADRAMFNQIRRMWGMTNPDEQGNLVASLYKAGQHPVWKRVAGTHKFLDNLMGNMMMSGMLYHPSTWGRVLNGVITSSMWDSGSQLVGSSLLKNISKGHPRLYEALFQGTNVDPATHDALALGALYRAVSLPHSLLVGGKSFLNPKIQELYNLGGHVIENGFGKDFATTVFSKGDSAATTAAKAAGAGLGLPMHVLQSFETIINHNALSSRIVEDLARRGTMQGLKGKELAGWVINNLGDVMGDALVTKMVGRGDVALSNQIGMSADDLRAIVKRASMNADYTSLRQSGQEAGSELANTKLGDTWPFRATNLISEALGKSPVAPKTLRSIVIPFGKVTANMLQRAVSPFQASASLLSRAVGIQGGPSAYIDEVLGGLHGAHAQSQLLGHTMLSMGMMGLGAASMWHLLHSGKEPNYIPLGDADAEREAANVRGVRYGESPLPDGGTLTTTGLMPYAGFYNSAAYATWILNKYRNVELGSPESIEAGAHFANLINQSTPVAPLFQGLEQIFGGSGDSENPVAGALAGLAGGVGKAVGRPLRIPDLMPGQQVDGRSMTLHDAGIGRAFQTSLAGAQSGPNINRINAYDISGDYVPDKYDPDSSLNQFVDAMGFPTYRPYDASPLGRYLGALESHGLSLPTPQRKQTLEMGVGNLQENVPINLTHFYNPKTKEHLWDVYNRFLREQRTSYDTKDGIKELTTMELLNAIAEKALQEGGSESQMVRNQGSKTRILSDSANEMVIRLQEQEDDAKRELERYINDHSTEFVNLMDEKQTLKDYAQFQHDIKHTTPIDVPAVQPSTEETENQ